MSASGVPCSGRELALQPNAYTSQRGLCSHGIGKTVGEMALGKAGQSCKCHHSLSPSLPLAFAYLGKLVGFFFPF